jgi:hypothetical protein
MVVTVDQFIDTPTVLDSFEGGLIEQHDDTRGLLLSLGGNTRCQFEWGRANIAGFEFLGLWLLDFGLLV